MEPRQFGRSKGDRDRRAIGMAAADSDRATSLLALALRAFASGNVDVANDLALLATQSFDKAEEIKRHAMADLRTAKRARRLRTAGTLQR